MGQIMSRNEKTNDDAFVNLEDLPWVLPHGTIVSVMFDDNTIKRGTVVVDYDYRRVGGVENIKVLFDDKTTQTFTSRDGKTIRVKVEEYKHYRGGIKRKTHKKRKIRRNKKSKSSYR